MSLPFLRPSPPPSTLYLRSFLRGSNSSSRRHPSSLRRSLVSSPYSTATSPPSPAVPTGSPPAADTKPSSAPAPAPSSSAAISSTPAEPEPAPAPVFETLTYHVHRTKSNQLPVYSDKKAGGTLLQTKVRKIEGDREALRLRLLKEMPALLKPEHVKINRLTGDIIIKGRVAREVAEVLRGMHF